MQKNEFTIGIPGGSMRNNKFFIISLIIFAFIFLFFDIPKNPIIKKLDIDISYQYYLLPAFLIFLGLFILYGIVKQKNIKTKLIIEKNNIFTKTYDKENVIAEKKFNKNSKFTMESFRTSSNYDIFLKNIKPTIFLTINDDMTGSQYTMNEKDIIDLNESLRFYGYQEIDEIESIINKNKIIHSENNFYYKVTLIAFLSLILIGVLAIVITVKYLL